MIYYYLGSTILIIFYFLTNTICFILSTCDQRTCIYRSGTYGLHQCIFIFRHYACIQPLSKMHCISYRKTKSKFFIFYCLSKKNARTNNN